MALDNIQILSRHDIKQILLDLYHVIEYSNYEILSSDEINLILNNDVSEVQVMPKSVHLYKYLTLDDMKSMNVQILKPNITTLRKMTNSGIQVLDFITHLSSNIPHSSTDILLDVEVPIGTNFSVVNGKLKLVGKNVIKFIDAYKSGNKFALVGRVIV